MLFLGVTGFLEPAACLMLNFDGVVEELCVHRQRQVGVLCEHETLPKRLNPLCPENERIYNSRYISMEYIMHSTKNFIGGVGVKVVDDNIVGVRLVDPLYPYIYIPEYGERGLTMCPLRHVSKVEENLEIVFLAVVRSLLYSTKTNSSMIKMVLMCDRRYGTGEVVLDIVTTEKCHTVVVRSEGVDSTFKIHEKMRGAVLSAYMHYIDFCIAHIPLRSKPPRQLREFFRTEKKYEKRSGMLTTCCIASEWRPRHHIFWVDASGSLISPEYSLLPIPTAKGMLEYGSCVVETANRTGNLTCKSLDVNFWPEHIAHFEFVWLCLQIVLACLLVFELTEE